MKYFYAVLLGVLVVAAAGSAAVYAQLNQDPSMFPPDQGSITIIPPPDYKALTLAELQA